MEWLNWDPKFVYWAGMACWGLLVTATIVIESSYVASLENAKEGKGRLAWFGLGQSHIQFDVEARFAKSARRNHQGKCRPSIQIRARFLRRRTRSAPIRAV